MEEDTAPPPRAESPQSDGDDDNALTESPENCQRCSNYKSNAVMAYKYARKAQHNLARLNDIENENGQLQKINIEQRSYIEDLLQKNQQLEREKSEATLFLRDTDRLYKELLERHRTVTSNVAVAQQHLSASNEYKQKYEDAKKALAEVAQKRFTLIEKYKQTVQLLQKELTRQKVAQRKVEDAAEHTKVVNKLLSSASFLIRTVRGLISELETGPKKVTKGLEKKIALINGRIEHFERLREFEKHPDRAASETTDSPSTSTVEQDELNEPVNEGLLESVLQEIEAPEQSTVARRVARTPRRPRTRKSTESISSSAAENSISEVPESSSATLPSAAGVVNTESECESPSWNERTSNLPGSSTESLLDAATHKPSLSKASVRKESQQMKAVTNAEEIPAMIEPTANVERPTEQNASGDRLPSCSHANDKPNLARNESFKRINSSSALKRNVSLSKAIPLLPTLPPSTKAEQKQAPKNKTPQQDPEPSYSLTQSSVSKDDLRKPQASLESTFKKAAAEISLDLESSKEPKSRAKISLESLTKQKQQDAKPVDPRKPSESIVAPVEIEVKNCEPKNKRSSLSFSLSALLENDFSRKSRTAASVLLSTEPERTVEEPPADGANRSDAEVSLRLAEQPKPLPASQDVEERKHVVEKNPTKKATFEKQRDRAASFPRIDLTQYIDDVGESDLSSPLVSPIPKKTQETTKKELMQPTDVSAEESEEPGAANEELIFADDFHDVANDHVLVVPSSTHGKKSTKKDFVATKVSKSKPTETDSLATFVDGSATADILSLMGKLCSDVPISALPMPDRFLTKVTSKRITRAAKSGVVPRKRSTEEDPCIQPNLALPIIKKPRKQRVVNEPVKRGRKRKLESEVQPQDDRPSDTILQSPVKQSVPVAVIAPLPKRTRGRPRKNAAPVDQLSVPKIAGFGHDEASILDVLQATINDSAAGYDCGKMHAKMQPFRNCVGQKDAKALSEGIVKIALRMEVGDLKIMLVKATQQAVDGASVVLGKPETALFEFVHQLMSFEGLNELCEMVFQDLLLECRKVRHTTGVQFSKFIRCLTFSYVLAIRTNEPCSKKLSPQLHAFLHEFLFSMSPDVTVPSLCYAITIVPEIVKDVFFSGDRDLSNDLLNLHLAGRADFKLLMSDLTTTYIGQAGKDLLVNRTASELIEFQRGLLDNAIRKALTHDESNISSIASSIKDCCALFMPFFEFENGVDRTAILSGMVAECDSMLNALATDFKNSELLSRASRLLHLTSRLIVIYGSSTTGGVAQFAATTLNRVIQKMRNYISTFTETSPTISSAVIMWIKAVQPFSRIALVSTSTL